MSSYPVELVIFNDIATTLKAAMPSIRDVTWWNNQLSNQSEENPIALPAVYVAIDIDWSAEAAGRQRGDATVTLHVVGESFENAYHQSVDYAGATENVNRVNDTYKAIQGLTGDNYTALERRRTVLDNNADHMIDHQLQFTCVITDDQLDFNNTYQKITPDLLSGRATIE